MSKELNWSACSASFVQDGSLRDIYVRGTTINDWERFYRFLIEKKLPLSYLRSDDRTAEFPSSIAKIMEDRRCGHTLSIDLSGILLNTHFFNDREIELDLDPRDVNSEDRFKSLVNFMGEIGRLLRKEVVLTSENAPEAVILRIEDRRRPN